MLGLHALKLCTGEDVVGGVIGDAGSLHHGLDQLISHDVVFVTDLHEGVIVLRAQADRQVAGNCPGRGRPDHEEDLVQIQAELGEHALVVGHAELDIDGTARIVLVLDLCLSQGSIAARNRRSRHRTHCGFI